jgi:type II secretory ATPase GspE/PulE/Tfp pilus assembly ATPase PilB-like protein
MHTIAPAEASKSRGDSGIIAAARPRLPLAGADPGPGGLHVVLLAHTAPDGLRSLTQDTCAALLSVAGRSLAELALESLRAAGIRSALVVLGPHAEQVERLLGTGERWGIALDFLRVPADEPEGAILARLGTELNGDILVIRCDVLRSPVVDRFLAAARARPGTSLWAAIGGVPAGLALVRREDAAWLDVPGTGGPAVWEQAGQRIQFRDATLSRMETVADYQRANLRVPASANLRVPASLATVPMVPAPRPDLTECARPAPEAPARPTGRHGRMAKFDYLVAQHLATRAQLAHATTEARQRQVSVESVLLEHHGIREADLAAALALYYRCPYVSLDERTLPAPELLAGLQRPRLRAGAWLPIKCVGDVVTVAVDDPHDLLKVDAIEAVLQPRKVALVVAVRERILSVLDGMPATEGRPGTVVDILGEVAVEPDTDDAVEAGSAEISENDSMVVRLANQIILDAHRARASDIHLEPRGSTRETAIRFRIDGTCLDYQRIPPALRNPLVARLKIMAGLDIAERRKPQDGKIRVRMAGRSDIELRVATVPTVGGNEDVVLRLLGSSGLLSLEHLGLTDRNLRELKVIAEKPYGLILCVGPTGAGKTTSLHAVLGHLNTGSRKIWTAEDPVEITQDGLRQVQVRPKIGYTFAAAMRALLRADPDIMMVGEMRDPETAGLAVEASITGHLVLSTLHTNSAVETVVRLLDLGLNPYNFADALLGVLAQRLVKRLCPDCRRPYHPTRRDWNELADAFGAEELEAHGYRYTDDLELFESPGCDQCDGKGYRERIAIHELLIGTDAIKRRMQKGARVPQILARAKREGMTTLVQDGILKTLQGVTDFRQVKAAAIR